MQAIAKVFKNGRSQAVRLPKEFRFQEKEVKITKIGDKVILEPIKKIEWPESFWEKFTLDEAFEIPRPLPSSSLSLD